MDTSELFFSAIFFFLLLCTDAALGSQRCSTAACGIARFRVGFPFRLKDRQEDRCGYPGFDLACSNTGQNVILTLPSAGEFTVTRIDYASQMIYINDPDFCLPKRMLSFSLSGSPFRGASPRNISFLNCSLSSDMPSFGLYQAVPITCLSGPNYTVLYADDPFVEPLPSFCWSILTVSIPAELPVYDLLSDINDDLQLTWSEPSCGDCVRKSGTCGFKSSSGLKIGCSGVPDHGLPRIAMYSMVIGSGIAGLVCIIVLTCYTFAKIKAYSRVRRLNAQLPTAAAAPEASAAQSQSAAAVTGIDTPTIESYLTTVLGEGRRLADLNDGTCPICLAEYQPGESIRTIPKCHHYFHASCVDGWLRMNATCPLCRNTPHALSLVAPCSSQTSSTSPSSVPS